MLNHCAFSAFLTSLLLVGCQTEPTPPVEGLKAFVGARVIDGTGKAPIDNAVLIVRDGRIEAVGSSDTVKIPEGAERIETTGKTIIPGLINSHGHVGGTLGLESGHYSEENVLRQLQLNARYGVTTVVSLGDDEAAAFRLRDHQDTTSLERARIYAAGAVITAETPDEARKKVDENLTLNPDFIKFRVDDNLGTTTKMSPEVYEAIIDQAHKSNVRAAAHVFYLEDAKSLVRAGLDYLAHSVRDEDVDPELIALMKENNVCLCPTLTREVSTYVYEDVPAFFEDPFFLKEAEPEILAQLEDPERQKQIRESRSAQLYKQALDVASRNVKLIVDGGARVAFGTDSGPPARFQGFFEHLELELMVEAGLTPMQTLVSATGNAARCLELSELGTLETGKWADFIVLERNPLEDIKNTRTIESVWISGNRVPGSGPR
jgi:imidazolonepropionase-like amidohydrolase